MLLVKTVVWAECLVCFIHILACHILKKCFSILTASILVTCAN